MRKEDIEISLHDGTLTISGERRREPLNGEKAERTERYVGKFRRSITLPTRVTKLLFLKPRFFWNIGRP